MRSCEKINTYCSEKLTKYVDIKFIVGEKEVIREEQISKHTKNYFQLGERGVFILLKRCFVIFLVASHYYNESRENRNTCSQCSKIAIDASSTAHFTLEWSVSFPISSAASRYLFSFIDATSRTSVCQLLPNTFPHNGGLDKEEN